MRWALSHFAEDGSETLSGKVGFEPRSSHSKTYSPRPVPTAFPHEDKQKTNMAKRVLQAAPPEETILITSVAATRTYCCCQVCTTLSCASNKPQSCHLSPSTCLWVRW